MANRKLNDEDRAIRKNYFLRPQDVAKLEELRLRFNMDSSAAMIRFLIENAQPDVAMELQKVMETESLAVALERARWAWQIYKKLQRISAEGKDLIVEDPHAPEKHERIILL